VVNSLINQDQDETNEFTLKKHGCDESPEFKLDIDITANAINKLLSSKQATLRLIISVQRAWDEMKADYGTIRAVKFNKPLLYDVNSFVRCMWLKVISFFMNALLLFVHCGTHLK